MKIQNTLLHWIFLVVLAACSTDGIGLIEENIDTASFTVDFGLAVPAHMQVQTRSGLNDLSSLKLLVFDEKKQFLYSRTAILKSRVDTADETFYPNTTSKPKELLTYSVQLLASEQPRSIHFIANYDWSDFKQDYFLQGLDEGQVIGAMESKNEVFWQSKTYPKLNKIEFTAQVVQLLRNQGLITLESDIDPIEFELTAYSLYNHYDRGTVAPFFWDETKQEGYFPNQPSQPTIPGTAHLVPQLELNMQPKGVFEHENHNQASLYIIFKGRYNRGAETYYKLDLKRKQSDGYRRPYLYSVLRNTRYHIKLSRVGTVGYKTLEEALAQPAGNNIYGSIELGDYPLVSDGNSTLEVGKAWEALVHKDQVFQTSVYYSGGLSKLKTIPSWGKEDPYLYPLENWKASDNRTNLKVKLKKVPTDRYLDYTIDIVGDTGQGYLLSRKIHVLVRSPYDFKVEFEKATENDRQNFNLSFTVPENFNKDLLPFEVKLLMWNATPQQNLDMQLANNEICYIYKITSESQLGKRQTIKFKRNTMLNSVSMKFICDYTTLVNTVADSY